MVFKYMIVPKQYIWVVTRGIFPSWSFTSSKQVGQIVGKFADKIDKIQQQNLIILSGDVSRQ